VRIGYQLNLRVLFSVCHLSLEAINLMDRKKTRIITKTSLYQCHIFLPEEAQTNSLFKEELDPPHFAVKLLRFLGEIISSIHDNTSFSGNSLFYY